MHDGGNGNDDGSGDKSLQTMSETDRLAELMDLMSQEGNCDDKLRKILAYVERVVSETD